MRRIRMMTVLAGAVLLAAACGGAEDVAGAGSGSGQAALVTTAAGDPGTLLTDADGFTLYLFTADSPGTSACTGTCLDVWPPLLTDGAPIAAGESDASLLGTLTRDDGTVQVTYAGWPLYRYVVDRTAGDVAGQGVDGMWFVISPAGEPIGAETEESAEPMDGASDDGGSSGYGY
jgi:predicted lipoprotein with Yx(FWY)xxD motif